MEAFYDAVADRLIPAQSAGPPPPPAADGQRAAAVLAPLCMKDGELHLLYFLRTDQVPTHKGQLCFPGGRYAEADATLLDTALRETEEEIGVPVADVRVLGYLGQQTTVTRRHAIQAFVGVIPYPFDFRPDPHEVAEIVIVPVQQLLDPDLCEVRQWEWEGRRVPMRYYHIHSTPLWGATAFLTELLLSKLGTLTEHPFVRGVTGAT